MAEDTPALVHKLRALTVELDLLGSEFARANGMHPTDVRALIALLDAHRAGTPATPGWLRTRLGLESATVTALVDRMETAGHVRRERDTADRRRVLISVTPSATALGWSFFGPLIAGATEHTGRFTDAEQNVIDRFLDGMLDAVRSAT